MQRSARCLFLPNPLTDETPGNHPPTGIVMGPFVLSRGVPEVEGSLAPGVQPIACGEAQ